MDIQHLESVILDHSEIHIIQGLLNSLQSGDIQSDTDMPFTQIYQLQFKLSEAHDSIVKKIEASL